MNNPEMTTQNTVDALALHNGFNQFYTQRSEGDIDLVAVVRRLLQEGGHPNLKEAFDEDPLIMEAANKTSVVQRWFLNRYWTIQLSSSPLDTRDIRLTFGDNGTPEEWLRIFNTYALPFILQNCLPTIIR